MKLRRRIVVTLPAVALAPLAHLALAHHGWSSFDESKPIYLEGVVKSVKWQNPHAEMVLDVEAGFSVPPDLAKAQVPKQVASVDAATILTNVTVPLRKDLRWTVELAPVIRLVAWKLPPIKAGERLAVVGYTFKDEKGDPVLRAEFVVRGNRVTPLRSGPA